MCRGSKSLQCCRAFGVRFARWCCHVGESHGQKQWQQRPARPTTAVVRLRFINNNRAERLSSGSRPATSSLFRGTREPEEGRDTQLSWISLMLSGFPAAVPVLRSTPYSFLSNTSRISSLDRYRSMFSDLCQTYPRIVGVYAAPDAATPFHPFFNTIS